MRSLLTIVVLWVTIMMAPAVFADGDNPFTPEETLRLSRIAMANQVISDVTEEFGRAYVNRTREELWVVSAYLAPDGTLVTQARHYWGERVRFMRGSTFATRVDEPVLGGDLIEKITSGPHVRITPDESNMDRIVERGSIQLLISGSRLTDAAKEHIRTVAIETIKNEAMAKDLLDKYRVRLQNIEDADQLSSLAHCIIGSGGDEEEVESRPEAIHAIEGGFYCKYENGRWVCGGEVGTNERGGCSNSHVPTDSGSPITNLLLIASSILLLAWRGRKIGHSMQCKT